MRESNNTFYLLIILTKAERELQIPDQLLNINIFSPSLKNF
jgi:hypothetical protein